LQANITNAGLIAVSGTGVLMLGGGGGTNLVNTGTIDAAGAGITIEADATVAGLDRIQLGNGNTIVYRSGTLDNTGDTLGAAAATTALQGFTLVSGAAIKGGVLDTTAGFVVNFPTLVFDLPAPPVTLDAIIGSNALNGLNVALAGGAAVYTDSTEATLATINVAHGALFLTGSNAATLSQSVDLYGGFLEAVTGSVSNNLTIGASTTVSGTGFIDAVPIPYDAGTTIDQANAAGLVNDGLIESTTLELPAGADAGGIQFAASSLDNQGTLDASGNVLELSFFSPESIDIESPQFTNAGLI
jgi:hypothetical protein